jgi:ABC-type multidrug transport system ATPase subunit
MQTVLSVKNISKKYGFIQALNNVSFDVPKGSVFGILGPNGSGKTTLLGIVLNVLQPSSGSFELLGKEPDADARKQIGTLLETPNFYHYLSAEKNLQIVAAIKGKGFNNIDNVLKKVNLLERKDSKFSTFSLGMKQRLAIAAALIGDPDVLILDEPTNGLDPVGIAEIRALIQTLSVEGKTIIMASHLLDEVEKVCNYVAILKKGILLTAGKVDEVLVNEEIVEVGCADLSKLMNVLSAYHPKQKDNLLQLYFKTGTAKLDDINKHCFDSGITLNHLHLKKKSLEAKFLEITNN